ncbi:hypothetical protein ACQBAT_14515 [Ornithinimicrobium sp. Y1847]|uniref:hypothetical protein n=1 Tax=unclassified Ornithinimicrobium TaxID=2615080 RepID=UPI003CE84190
MQPPPTAAHSWDAPLDGLCSRHTYEISMPDPGTTVQQGEEPDGFGTPEQREAAQAGNPRVEITVGD